MTMNQALRIFDQEVAPDAIDLHHVIYPEDVYVTADVILGWAHDALVNGAVDDHVKQHGVLPDGPEGERIWAAIAAANPRPTDLQEAIDLLSDIGSHTFARG